MTAEPGGPSILHVDMDAFYASVEVREDPSLAGQPVIVGGSGDRGVVASCSYEARAYGVTSAMASVRARRLCPSAVFVHGDHSRYGDVSRQLHAIFNAYTPLVEGIALDEAFLDVAGAVALFGPGPKIAHAIRDRVAAELGLACSVGVATSKLVAKLASKAAKPRAALSGPIPGAGVVVVEPGTELSFLHPLPVNALWGVGPATEERLRRFGITTVGDLAALPLETLVSALGRANGTHLHHLAWGRDARPVTPSTGVKSVGHEETYAVDLVDDDDLHREVVRMADAVATRLRAGGVAGRTVTLKVRFSDFTTITRSSTVSSPVDTGHVVAATAIRLLEQVDPTPGVRLLGVSVSSLAPASGAGAALQLVFDDASGPDWGGAAKAVDEIRSRFGDLAVGPAALVRDGSLRVKRRGEQQWGPRGRSDR